MDLSLLIEGLPNTEPETMQILALNEYLMEFRIFAADVDGNYQ